MPLGTLVDLTNRVVAIVDCGFVGDCRYCEEEVCAGCVDITYVENGEFICSSCLMTKRLEEKDAPLPQDFLIDSPVAYADQYGES